jgi:hypothetical protein
VTLNTDKQWIMGFIALKYNVSVNLSKVKVSNTSTNCILSKKFWLNNTGLIYHEKNKESRSNISKLKRVM